MEALKVHHYVTTRASRSRNTKLINDRHDNSVFFSRFSYLYVIILFTHLAYFTIISHLLIGPI